MHEKKPPLVANPRDPRFLSLRSLQTSPGRSRTNLYLIEGIRHLARAVEEHAPIESVFFDPSVLSNRFGRKLLRRVLQSCVPAIRLSPQLYRDLTLAAEPQGIGGVLRQRCVPIERLPHPCHVLCDRVGILTTYPGARREGHDYSGEPHPSRFSKGGNQLNDSLYLAVESIDSPGNLGTIIRTAEAAGVTGIFLLGLTDDPWHPAAVRASMGSLFSQKLVKCSPQEFTAWARSRDVATIASSPSGLLDYKALRGVLHPAVEPALSDRAQRGSRKGPAALLMGSEKRGLSPHLIEASSFTVRIPMRGRCDSINVAVATGVLLFEMSSHH